MAKAKKEPEVKEALKSADNYINEKNEKIDLLVNRIKNFKATDSSDAVRQLLHIQVDMLELIKRK